MNTNELKKFAQAARRQLMEQVGARLKLILQMDTTELREKVKAVKELQDQIAKTSQEAVIERVAYIWFNRFCAIRFMDVNRYTKAGIVTPAEGFSQPEILQEAKQGHIDGDLQANQQMVFDLLGGKAVSTDPQQEAYRLLLVAFCNSYHKLMPFMFERIADYTELLMPDDLLSENSILHAVRKAITEENCKDVEIIGWLYQFYISEKKDEVINRRSVVAKDEIPAATQLFTPKWIVKYMVENSLGRLWMLNRPQSRLIHQMDYYIKHEQHNSDFLKIKKPEDIKLCDPACGSGHILVYAFDLLFAMYEEEGYDQKEIPNLIITKNLSGIEIDDRAGALTAFSLTMKARQKYRRFLRKPVPPNICVLENVEFDEGEIKNYMDEVGRDLFTMNLQATLHQFEEADNFGSLIQPAETNVHDVCNRLEAKGIGSNLFLVNTHQKVLKVLNQADYLSAKYNVVVANPPYMGGKAMNGRLKAFLQDNYSNTKADLFAAFIIRNIELTIQGGQLGFVVPFVWMFISSYENLRNFILSKTTITCLAQLEYNAFAPACIPVATFTLENANHPPFKGGYIRLSDFRGCENQGPKTLEAIKNPKCEWFYRASAADLKKIPGSPIAYWASNRVRKVFETSASLGTIGSPTHGVVTGDNNRFLKNWSEISKSNICFTAKTREDSVSSGVRWFPVSKGGPFRRWFGNNEFVIDWFNDGHELRTTKHHTGRIRATNFNLGRIFQPGITWSTISSSSLSMRYLPEGMIFESKGSVCFSDMEEQRLFLLALTNTHVINALLLIMSPTLDYHEGPISRLPIVDIDTTKPVEIADSCYQLSKRDWDSHESSWDFSRLPILLLEYRQSTLNRTYTKLYTHWQVTTREMRLLEEENNCIFINGYGLQDELKPEVPVKGITLSCNPHYRYGGNKSEEELEVLLLADTMKEFVSYSVGCMFGRYSLDKPGLILANQGEIVDDYLSQIPKSTFEPDNDNVIPILDGEWFIDDIAGRFRKFLKVTFGEEHYEENLKFLEKAICKDIRKYFLKDFFIDHVKRYKKCPIYWQFSSPKGSFNALIYMHRYRPDTVSIILNDYLREFSTKLISRREHLETISINASASTTEKTKALKEIEKLKKTITELDEYERDILYPLATQKIEIDLDDGVKVNYPKFGKALKKVPGLS